MSGKYWFWRVLLIVNGCNVFINLFQGNHLWAGICLGLTVLSYLEMDKAKRQ